MKKIAFCLCIIVTLFFVSSSSVYASQTTHVVRGGDTLWAIARANNVSVQYLMETNNLRSDFLNIGDVIVLKRGSSSATTPAISVSSPSNLVVANTTYYIVKPGDSLWAIATRHGSTVNDLKSANALVSDLIHVGQRLKISSGSQTQSANISVSRSGTGISENRVLEIAAQHLGTPYRYGGASPGGFDCSGFVMYVFGQANYNLPRTAAAQYQHGSSVNRGELRAGDLVFFKRPGASAIDHVGIYTSNGNFIHSSSPRSGGVIYTSLSESYYNNSYYGAKRILGR